MSSVGSELFLAYDRTLYEGAGGQVEVGVVEHDVCRLAAELERQALQVARRRALDLLPDLRRAGEEDLVDVPRGRRARRPPRPRP
jgi:hypothetical protein